MQIIKVLKADSQKEMFHIQLDLPHGHIQFIRKAPGQQPNK